MTNLALKFISNNPTTNITVSKITTIDGASFP